MCFWKLLREPCACERKGGNQRFFPEDEMKCVKRSEGHGSRSEAMAHQETIPTMGSCVLLANFFIVSYRVLLIGESFLKYPRASLTKMSRLATISDLLASRPWGNKEVEIEAWLCRVVDKHGFVYKACPKRLPDGRTCLRKVGDAVSGPQNALLDPTHDCDTTDLPLDCYRFSFYICDGTGVMRVSIFQAATTLFSVDPSRFAKMDFASQKALAEALLDKQFIFNISLKHRNAVVKKVKAFP